jgi:hypothetical protein
MSDTSLKKPSPAADVVNGLALGALCGAVQVSTACLLLGIGQGKVSDGLGLAVLVFPVALIVWSLGLAAIGAPGLLLLRIVNWDRRWTLAAYGAGASALTYASVSPGSFIFGPFPLQSANTVLLGVMGAVVGWVAQSYIRRKRAMR